MSLTAIQVSIGYCPRAVYAILEVRKWRTLLLCLLFSASELFDLCVERIKLFTDCTPTYFTVRYMPFLDCYLRTRHPLLRALLVKRTADSPVA